MRLFQSTGSLPLGVDFRNGSLSIVALEEHAQGVDIREAGTVALPAFDETIVDLRVAQAVRELLATFTTHERRCVLAAPAGEVVCRPFHLSPGTRRAEAYRAAALEADVLAPWSAAERSVSLDPLPNLDGAMLLSVARREPLENRLALTRAAGLKPVAVDIPGCVWRRAVTGADAVLDCSGERATLTIFAEPLGPTQLFAPRLLADRLAGQVRAAFVEARRSGLADVQRVAIAGDADRAEAIGELLVADGYTLATVRIGETEAPSWLFAYGLASWASASRRLIGT
jgi:Type IV pilus assembly protein PilM